MMDLGRPGEAQRTYQYPYNLRPLQKANLINLYFLEFPFFLVKTSNIQFFFYFK
jgi:hypothetical protein